MFAFTSLTNAQTGNHVAWSKIEADAWTLHPIYSESAAGSVAVTHFLALADPGEAIGDNIVGVLYERGSSGWSTKSWTTSNCWEVIKAVKLELGISDSEDVRWHLEGSDAGIGAPETATDYTAGVLSDDPLAALVASSPDRDFVVELLADMGYAAADVPVEKSDGCTTDAKLDGMADAIFETLIGDEETAADRSMAAWVASGAAGCGIGSVAVEIVVFPPRPVTPWTPPTYICTPVIYPPAPGGGFSIWCTTETWTETRTTTQRRTRSRLNPTPPPTYQFCDQTRSGTEVRTTTCSICGNLIVSPPAPCPPAPAPGSPIPATCAAGWTRTTSTTTSWGGWVPPCPF